MDAQKLSSLLEPYVAEPLNASGLDQLLTYLNLLLKWNSKMNLTAIRQPDEIVTRHFGESLFAAEILRSLLEDRNALLDLGSGAGFPGLPIKIAIPQLHVMLAESQNKKSTFLKEVVRSLALVNTEVYAGRAEGLKQQFDIVTMRAVDGQENLLQSATQLLASDGFLLLMLGSAGLESTKATLQDLTWREPRRSPGGDARWILVGRKDN